MQDPSLSIPRQHRVGSAFTATHGWQLVKSCWDIESGRKELDLRGDGADGTLFGIEVPRDGGLPELLEFARNGEIDAVVVESIDRLSRSTADSTWIERELLSYGVPIFACDEPVNLEATGILTRRVKQGIAEYYVGRRRSVTRSSTTRSSATGGCTRTAGCSPSGCSGSRGRSTRRCFAASGRAGTPTRIRSSSTTCPDDFAQSKNVAADNPEKVKELRELFWAEAERNSVLPLLGGLTSFFGMVPPIPKESTFVFRGDIQNIPSGMIPRIYNHSYTISADLVIPDGRRGGRDRRRGRPPRRLRALRAGREAQAHLLDARRARVHPGVGDAAPDRRGQRRARLHRRRAEAGDRRRGDAARQRRAGRERADGAHRARPLLGLLRHGHRPRQRPRRRPQLCRQGAVRLHGRDQARHLRHSSGPERRKTQRLSTSSRNRRSRPTPQAHRRKEQG